MRHGFYLKPKKEQLQIQLAIGFLALGVLLVTFYVSWMTGFYLLAILSLPVVLSVVAPFFDTPSLMKRGELIYYSPLFLAERPRDGRITIHGGTLFDYVFVIDRKLNGRQRTNFIIQQYLEGLLKLIVANQSGSFENLKITGTSYIINERTAQRIGFEVVETDYLQKGILIYNYFNLLLTYSISKGRLAFPKLGDTKTFETSIGELTKRKELISHLNERLKANRVDR